MRQNPTMWANTAAANLATVKNGHSTENDSSGDAMMESTLTGTYGAAAVAAMDSQPFREEAELLRKKNTKTQAIRRGMTDVATVSDTAINFWNLPQGSLYSICQGCYNVRGHDIYLNQDYASNRDTAAWTHGDCSRGDANSFRIMGPVRVAACRPQSTRSRA